MKFYFFISQKKTYPSAQVGQVNPPKFEKCDDMVNLTYLNDASVFHNLEGRYKAKLIHTCKSSLLTFSQHDNNWARIKILEC
jgi:myosin heavy subunit